MSHVVQALKQYGLPGLVWGLVVWAAAAYLLVLCALVLMRPALVSGFFEGIHEQWEASLRC